MNKSDLISSIAIKSGLNKKSSEAALNAILSSIEDALQNGNKVSLVGFGSLETKTRAERLGRNPATKQEIKIPSHKTVVFRAGKSLKDAIK